MNEELQEQLLEVFDKRFQDYNTKVLEELGKVIKQFKDLTPTQAYKLARQLEFNTTIEDLLNELSKLTGMSVNDLKKILEKVAKENLQFADVYYKAKGMEAPVYSEDKRLTTLVNAISRLNGNEMKNIAKTTAFRLLDRYGFPILLDIDETYNYVIDKCVMAISQGKETYQQAMRSTIKQLAKSGVRSVQYKSGYSRRLDTSMRMNILDSIRTISNESQQIIGEDIGADGVEISVHETPAPDHEYAQGRQFTNEEFEKLQETGVAKDYTGKVVDLHSWLKDGSVTDSFRPISQFNCYHYIFSIVLGVNEPQYNNKQLEDMVVNAHKTIKFDGKELTMYEATQLQRRIETAIRESKDEHILAKASEDNDLMLKCQTRITQLTTKYKQLCKISGLPNKLSTRASVSGYQKISKKKLGG